MSMNADVMASVLIQALQRNPSAIASALASNPAALSSLFPTDAPGVIDISTSPSTPSSSGSQPSRSLSHPNLSNTAPINLFGIGSPTPAIAPLPAFAPSRQSYVDCDLYFTAGQARKRGTNTEQRKLFLEKIREECHKQQAQTINIEMHTLIFEFI